ncbi:MAG TPA: hypothetical protein VGT03_00395 [Candidatus Acidoferrales bacterium]|nr:hypothetical protein [Candidatus Acidoferrales bacterium]
MSTGFDSDEVCITKAAPETRVLEIEPTEEHQPFEEQIECRLNELGNLIAGFMDSPYPGVLRESNSIREALDELAVEEATLRWILRTAKHSRGVVRYALWLQLARVLVDCEKIGKEIAHPNSGTHAMAAGGASSDALHGRRQRPALEA